MESKGERLVLNVSEVQALLGLSRNAVYLACARGDLPVLRCGKRILIPKAALQSLLEKAGQVKPS